MTSNFALAALLAAGLTCDAQTVTVQPSTISGIDIVGPQSPDFAPSVAQIVGTDQSSNFLAWIPYGVVIKNNSSQALAGIDVVWIVALDATSPLGHGGSMSDQWFNAPSQQLQPGQSMVVLPQAFLRQPRDLKRYAQGSGMGNLQNYQRMQRIGVFIDGVVFASGQWVGPDTYSGYERFQAEINAPRSVASTVLEMKATSPISDILGWLQPLAAKRGGDFTAQRSGSIARQLLGAYSRRGEAAFYSMAEMFLQQPAFPLHR